MTSSHRAAVLALLATLAFAACSSPSAATKGPAGATTPAPVATSAGAPTTGAVAGEPSSFLTAEAVGAIVGTTPVEVAERVGRGDCDYWLTPAKDSWVNIGVVTGADAAR